MNLQQPKVQGVPKETRQRNSIPALQQALGEAFPGCAWSTVSQRLEHLGYFEAGMQEQIRLLARVAVDVATAEPGALLQGLGRSNEDKVRGVAAFAVPLVHGGDFAAQLDALTLTGAFEGTWPHELSATVLHNLVIEHGLEAMAPWIAKWTAHGDDALRRMAVEALRPRGVMLAHVVVLKQDPTPLKAILEPLLDDLSDYVRRAVANNLNDVSQDNPDAVLAWTSEWLTPNASRERRWVLGRALRTLLDKGNLEALRILGYSRATSLRLTWMGETPAQIRVGDALEARFRVENITEAEALVHLLMRIDAPGVGRNRRSFTYQIWRGTIVAGEVSLVGKAIRLRDTSTQRKEPGIYHLVVRLNGETACSRDTELVR